MLNIFSCGSIYTSSFRKLMIPPGVMTESKIRKIDFEFVCRKSTNRWEIPTKNVGFKYTAPCI